LFMQQAGRYTVEVYTDTSFAQSKQAKYVTIANGTTTETMIDQTAVNGWQTLGTFDFAAGGHQTIHLGDNSGEPPASNVQIVFDAVRLTHVGDGDGGGTDPDSPPHAGCVVGGNVGLGLIVALCGLRRRRRR